MKICTEPGKSIGFRPSQPHGSGVIGWRAWAGPFLLARVHTGRLVGWWSSRGAGWEGPRAYSVTVLGLSFALNLHSRKATR